MRDSDDRLKREDIYSEYMPELQDDEGDGFDICEPSSAEPVTRNATPFAVASFVAAAFLLALGFIFLFSDIDVTTGGLIESPIVNKLIASATMAAIALLFLFFGFHCLKEAKKYYKDKKAMKSEEVDQNVKDEIWKRTCPNCGESHDIDYPKCPNCKYSYIE